MSGSGRMCDMPYLFVSGLCLTTFIVRHAGTDRRGRDRKDMSHSMYS